RVCACARNIERGARPEAVTDIVCVNVPSCDRSGRVNGFGHGPLPRASARAWNVERGDGSIRGAHETVIHIVHINVLTLDRSSVVDAGTLGALVRTGARAWSVEDRYGAIGSAQVAVIDIVRVNGDSGDCPSRIEIIDGILAYCRALAGSSACAWGVERGDGASRIAHEAVSDSLRVKVVSRNCPTVVDHISEGTLLGPRACARGIECDDATP